MAVSHINAAKKFEQKDKLDKAKKRYEKAQKLLIQSNKKFPNKADTLNYLGFTTRKLGDFENGEKYKGYSKETKKHGLGSYVYSNGEIFNGEFKNNIRDGKGYIVFRGDTTKSGVWLADKFIKKERLKNVKKAFRSNLSKI